MEGAIVLIIIVIVAIFIIPIFIASNSNSKISDLSKEILAIKNYLKTLNEQSSKQPSRIDQSNEEFIRLKLMIEKLQSTLESKTFAPSNEQTISNTDSPWQRKEVEEIPSIIINEIAPEIIKEAIQAEETPQTKETIEQENIIEASKVTEQGEPVEMEQTEEAIPAVTLAEPVEAGISNRFETISATDKPYTPPPPKKKSDLEQFIGEKLISIVGITILVLGIFFSVKWAIDRHLISDAGKI